MRVLLHHGNQEAEVHFSGTVPMQVEQDYLAFSHSGRAGGFDVDSIGKRTFSDRDTPQSVLMQNRDACKAISVGVDRHTTLELGSRSRVTGAQPGPDFIATRDGRLDEGTHVGLAILQPALDFAGLQPRHSIERLALKPFR